MDSKLILYTVSFLLLGEILFCNGQDCVFYGRRCSENSQCCGGCCIQGVCIDTYNSCSLVNHFCSEKICPAGLSCQVFKPDDCEECELQAICV